MSPKIKTRNYKVLDIAQIVVALLFVIAAMIWLPTGNLFVSALLGCIPAVLIVTGYQIWRPSDEEIELEESLAQSVNFAVFLTRKGSRLNQVGELIANIAVVIFTEGILRHRQVVNHLARIVNSVRTYVETGNMSDIDDVLTVLGELQSKVNENRARRFQEASQEVEFLKKLYSSNSAAGRAVELLQQILTRSEKERSS